MRDAPADPPVRRPRRASRPSDRAGEAARGGIRTLRWLAWALASCRHEAESPSPLMQGVWTYEVLSVDESAGCADSPCSKNLCEDLSGPDEFTVSGRRVVGAAADELLLPASDRPAFTLSATDSCTYGADTGLRSFTLEEVLSFSVEADERAARVGRQVSGASETCAADTASTCEVTLDEAWRWVRELDRL